MLALLLLLLLSAQLHVLHSLSPLLWQKLQQRLLLFHPQR
jgi:hypothetical protein